MEREVSFRAAYDKRDPDPNKNYGVHGVDIFFVLRGEQGAITFCLFTDWVLPHVARWWESIGATRFCDPFVPQTGGLTFHSASPHPDGSGPNECNWLPGGRCYQRMSSTIHEREVADRLIREGGEGVWAAMEGWYKETFGEDGE